jgi:hypothetical protein
MSRVKHCDSNGKVYVANVINTQMFLIACKGIIKDPTKFFYLSCYDNGCNNLLDTLELILSTFWITYITFIDKVK